MGGLVSRAYIESSAYRGDVEALITLGTPHTGVNINALIKVNALFNPGIWRVSNIVCTVSPGFCQLGRNQAWLFNQVHQPRPEVPYLFVGGSGGPDWLGFLNRTEGRNDGIVGYRSGTGYLFRGLQSDQLLVLGASIARRYSDSSHGSIPGASKPWYFDDPQVESCVGSFLEVYALSACATMTTPMFGATLAQTEAEPAAFTPLESGILTSGSTITVPITIDGSHAQVMLGSSDGQLRLDLTTPNGVTVSSATVAQLIPGATYVGPSSPTDPPLIAYTLPNPADGTWVATISTTNVVTETNYALVTAIESPLRMHLDIPNSVVASQPFTLTATISDTDRMIDEATVVATLPQDSGTQEVVLSRRAPGVYTGQMTAPAAAGPHQFTVAAQGDSTRAFSRQQDALLTVQASGVERLGSGAATPVDSNGNGRYELLRITASYRVDEAGEYGVLATLQHTDGRVIALTQRMVTWVSGVNALELPLDGNTILASGIDGPYQVVLQVVSRDTSQLVVDEQPLLSSLNYQAADFEAVATGVIYLPLVRR
jgi:hypothetical protein